MSTTDYLLMALGEIAVISAVFMIGCWWGDALDRRQERNR